MRSDIMRSVAVLQLTSVVAATVQTVDIGTDASKFSSDDWASVMENPTNSSSAMFTGYDITKPFPGTKQEGWELETAISDSVQISGSDMTATTLSIMAPSGDKDVDDSWNFCLHTFIVKAGSAASWGSGASPSCHGLVAEECIEDLTKNAISKYENGCPVYKSTASCLRDLDEQTSVSLAVSAANAADTFGNSSFYRRVDGDAGAFETAAGQPMAVVTVFGPSGDSKDKPMAVVACVMPNAVEEKSAATTTAAFFGWTVLSVAAALHLIF